MWVCVPLPILGVGQHPVASAFHPVGVEFLQPFVVGRFECSMTSAVLIVQIPPILFLVFSLYLVELVFR